MDIPFVQILDGKTKFVVVPHNVAEIDGPLCLIGKRKMNLMFAQILCLRNGDGFHLERTKNEFGFSGEMTVLSFQSNF